MMGIYTVNSVDARTFVLQFRSSDAGNMQSAIGACTMTILEVAA